MAFIVSNTFLFTPQRPTALPEDDVAAIVAAIQQALADAVNGGTNASLCIHIHPNHFLSNGGLTFLNGLEGTITSQSMQHLEVVSDQGGRNVLVQFVGGGTLFAVAHHVDDNEAPAEKEEPTGNEDDGDDNEGNGEEGDDSSSGSSTRFEPDDDSDDSSDFRRGFPRS
ncbi:hypothetical protein SEMRO_387_G132120.1 [Seminavis robusta]|uniref:Uncharacterized protein n=1 Tax=Seminavis robusta TaxID=568900 RepID=A0A9N8DUS2_9STRA|nr:hypothetical protein SEMRO_387_G132120.1 [Seminavis robusta]|eukprot:Sro387_g132120.1 n/a (168) ;mRNA; f:41378-41881